MSNFDLLCKISNASPPFQIIGIQHLLETITNTAYVGRESAENFTTGCMPCSVRSYDMMLLYQELYCCSKKENEESYSTHYCCFCFVTEEDPQLPAWRFSPLARPWSQVSSLLPPAPWSPSAAVCNSVQFPLFKLLDGGPYTSTYFELPRRSNYAWNYGFTTMRYWPPHKPIARVLQCTCMYNPIWFLGLNIFLSDRVPEPRIVEVVCSRGNQFHCIARPWNRASGS